MAIQPQSLLDHDFGVIEQSYEPRDAILYALGLGVGQDPTDPFDLAMLDEAHLSVLSTYAVTMASPGMWIKDPAFGVDFSKLVHTEQMAWFKDELPASGRIKGRAKVKSLTDRGEGRGAVLVVEREIEDAATGALYCRLQQTLLLRGDGGFGGMVAPRNADVLPDRVPDQIATAATSPRAALIYRLSGDWNPLHISPVAAKAAGFERPILHGLASYGIAGTTISRALSQDPGNLSQLGCRFSGIVIPGDEIRFEIWAGEHNGAFFRAFVNDRKVLDDGRINWENG
jgi:acyl dehydratase